MRDSISWYRVSIGLLCLYILEKSEDLVTPMPDIRQTTEYRTTELVESIKFKLSHAILIKAQANLLCQQISLPFELFDLWPCLAAITF